MKGVTSTGHLNIFGTGRSLRWAVTVACQMAFILFGYDQGVFSGIIGNEDFRATFGYPGEALEGIIVSIYNLGCFSGCITAFLLCERLGRRKCMWLAMCFIIVGGTLQTSASSVPHIMVGRFITGIGTGIETSTVPMYQSELCEAEKRGRLVSSEPLFVGVGIEIAYWFDYGMSFVPGSIAWRLPIACKMIFAFVVVFMVFGLPESPRYLYKHGRNEEARAVLCEVYGRTPDDPKIEQEEKDVLEALRMEEEHGDYKWSQLLKKDDVQTGRRVLLAYGSMFMQQVGGINLVVYFITAVLERNVGMTRNMSLLMGGVINSMFFFGSLFPTFFLDKFGRRRPMMVGCFLCGASMMLIAALLSPQEQGGAIAQRASSASVTFFFTYMLFFGATMNCVPWVYVPEILPLHVRAKGTAVAISGNWLWNFFVVMITPTIIGQLQWKAYLIFMATNFAFVPAIYFFYPETTNLSLEEIDYLFLEKNVVKHSKEVWKKGLSADERRRMREAGLEEGGPVVADTGKEGHAGEQRQQETTGKA